MIWGGTADDILEAGGGQERCAQGGSATVDGVNMLFITREVAVVGILANLDFDGQEC